MCRNLMCIVVIKNDVCVYTSSFHFLFMFKCSSRLKISNLMMPLLESVLKSKRFKSKLTLSVGCVLCYLNLLRIKSNNASIAAYIWQLTSHLKPQGLQETDVL